MKKLFSTMILMIGMAFIAHAQKKDTLPTGMVTNPQALQQETGKYLLYWDLPGGGYRHVSLETRTIVQLDFKGTPTWAFIQTYQSDKGSDSDTTYFNAATLQPLAYRTHIVSEAYREIIDFVQDNLFTKIIYRDSVTSNEKRIPYTYVNAPMEDYFIAQLPLQQGYSTTYHWLNPGKHHWEGYSTITVTGSEILDLPGSQQVDCWKIQCGNAANTSTLWYSKNGRQFIKRKFGTVQKGIFWKVKIL